MAHAVRPLTRNSKLLDYLYSQMDRAPVSKNIRSRDQQRTSVPSTANTNAAQMVIQFFDYIRSTNLYDGVLGTRQ
jgi:hypothetical protein